MTELTHDQIRILEYLEDRRSWTEQPRMPIPPVTVMGIALHHYPGRQPICEVLPPLTWKGRLALILMVGMLTSTGCAMAYMVARLVIEICLWASGPGGFL